jgi:hypothetical protein
VDAAQGIAAEALAGDEGTNGLAAPADGTQGTPSPLPFGQEGATPAYGQAGVAPCGEERAEGLPSPLPQSGGPAQQAAPAWPDSGVWASSGDAGSGEPAPRRRPGSYRVNSEAWA